MKKLLFIILMLFIQASATQAFTKPEKSSFRPKIRVTVFIASERKDCEGGLGLCIGGIYFSGREAGSGRVVSADCFIEEGILNLFILKEFTSPEVKEEFSSSRFFSIEEEQAVPEYLLEQLGEKQPLQIMAMDYPVINEGEYYLVQLNVR